MAKTVKVTKTAKHAKKAVKETHVVLRGSKRGKDPNAVKIGKIDPSEEIVVTIGLAGPNCLVRMKLWVKRFRPRNSPSDMVRVRKMQIESPPR